MTAYLFDAAYKPDLAAVKRNGGIAMSVYLTGRFANTCAQPGELHALGLGVLGNYEEAADELVHAGHSGGVSVGQRAAAAYIAKGAPPRQGLGIAFSVDVEVQPAQFPAIGEAFDGIGMGLGGQFVPHVYGEGALIDYLVSHHQVTGVQWLSGSSAFPGYNPKDVNVGLVQSMTTPVPNTDLDQINVLAGLGIWWPLGSPYLKPPVVPASGRPQPQGAPILSMFNVATDAHGNALPAPHDVWVFAPGYAHKVVNGAEIALLGRVGVQHMGAISTTERDQLHLMMAPPKPGPA